MRLRCLFEYGGGLEVKRADGDDVYALLYRPGAMLGVYHTATGTFLKSPTASASHSNLIWRLGNKGVENPDNVARAYWFPEKGALVLYQMETPNRRLVDPPEQIFDAFIDNFGIRDQVTQLYVIG
jgi:hypothetical protein